MKKVLVILTIMLLVATPTAFASAADEADVKEVTVAAPILEANAGTDISVPVGKKVSFDASASTVPNDVAASYFWYFGDNAQAVGANEVHTYYTPGIYDVKLIIRVGNESSEDTIKVSVYEDLIVLLSNDTLKSDDLAALQSFAAQRGVLIENIRDASGQPDYVVIEKLAEGLNSSQEALRMAGLIVDWTSGGIGLNALSKFAQKQDDVGNFNINKKAIISISKNPGVISRIAQSTFDVLRPEYIVIADDKAINSVIESGNPVTLLENLSFSENDYKIIGYHSQRSVTKLGFTNFLAVGNNYLVNKGLPVNTVFLILMLPIIATIITIFRQLVGIKTLGVFIPSVITLAFLVTGLIYGIIIFAALLVAATLIRYLLRRFRLLFIPRMAIVLTGAALTILILFLLGALTERFSLLAISVFPIIIIMLLVEKFIEVQTEEDFRTAVIVSIETLIIVIICYYLAGWSDFRAIILGYPELILLTIPINFLMGRWTRLSMFEYFRFRKTINGK